MSAVRLPRHHHSFEEYLKLCADSSIRLEYWGGQILAMAGGSIEHSRLSARIVSLFDQRRPKACVALESNVRIRPLASDRATYGDAVLVCGELEYHPSDSERQTLSNPTVVAEVLSDSTAEDDRTDKFDHYALAPSLTDYLLISQAEQLVEHRRRSGAAWQVQSFGPGETVELSNGVRFTVDELYAR